MTDDRNLSFTDKLAKRWQIFKETDGIWGGLVAVSDYNESQQALDNKELLENLAKNQKMTKEQYLETHTIPGVVGAAADKVTGIFKIIIFLALIVGAFYVYNNFIKKGR